MTKPFTTQPKAESNPQASDSPPLSVSIIEAVHAQTEQERDDLPPLYDVLDPDALVNLFTITAGETERTNGEVRFRYAGQWVTVAAGHSITVESLD
ncbi:HalOD1 output domain-containing protein [Haladaptatus sp. NG-WS-4]